MVNQVYDLDINNNIFFKSFFKSDKIFKAFLFAKKVHSGQKRKSGIDYVIHPIEVAIKLHQKYNDEVLTISGLLHDTVEDCDDVKIEDIYQEFGYEVGFIVDSLNKRENILYEFPDLDFKDKISRFLWSGIHNVKVFLTKIADRENNLETIYELKSNKQVRMTFETQAIFEPLKNILKYDSDIDLIQITQNFQDFLIKNNIDKSFDKIDKFKTILYDESFNDFNESLFNIVYENSSHIVWKVEGWDIYDKLCAQDCFKDKINILKVESDGKNLRVDFKFKKGIVLNKNNNLKMGISTFNEK